MSKINVGVRGVPKWILAYSVFLVLFGIVLSVLLIVLPRMVFGDVVLDDVGGQYAVGLIWVRVTVFTFMVFVGLLWRNPIFLMAILMLRGITDAVDMVVTLVLAFMSEQVAPFNIAFGFDVIDPGVLNVVLYVVVLVVLIIPSALATLVLARRIFRSGTNPDTTGNA